LGLLGSQKLKLQKIDVHVKEPDLSGDSQPILKSPDKSGSSNALA